MTLYNVGKLTEELLAAGIPVEGCDSTGTIWYLPTVTPEQIALAETIKAAHDPTDYITPVKAGARAALEAVPGWATYTEAEANAWYQMNVRDPYAAATTLAAMRIVIGILVDVIWALCRVVIALRNHTWPDLQD